MRAGADPESAAAKAEALARAVEEAAQREIERHERALATKRAAILAEAQRRKGEALGSKQRGYRAPDAGHRGSVVTAAAGDANRLRPQFSTPTEPGLVEGMEGYLLKRARGKFSDGSLQRRWCVARGHYFLYYRSEKKEEVLGDYDLDFAKAAHLRPGADHVTMSDVEVPFHDQEHPLRLRAGTAREAEAWKAALDRLMAGRAVSDAALAAQREREAVEREAEAALERAEAEARWQKATTAARRALLAKKARLRAERSLDRSKKRVTAARDKSGKLQRNDKLYLADKRLRKKGKERHRFRKSVYEHAKGPVAGAVGVAGIEGYLDKKASALHGTYQRRYFVARGHYLLYFATRAQKKVLSSIELDLVEAVELADKDTDFLVRFVSGEAAMRLRADTPDECVSWVHALQRLMEARGLADENAELERKLAVMRAQRSDAEEAAAVAARGGPPPAAPSLLRSEEHACRAALAAFYRARAPPVVRTAREIDEVVAYYVTRGGARDDPRPGVAQLNEQLRRQYGGADLGDVGGAAARLQARRLTGSGLSPAALAAAGHGPQSPSVGRGRKGSELGSRMEAFGFKQRRSPRRSVVAAANNRSPLAAKYAGCAALHGYLQKRSTAMHSMYQKRFFVARGKYLFYYRSSLRERLLASVDLGGVESVALCPERNARRTDFRVVAPGRTTRLRAETKDEAARWVRGLRELVAVTNGDPPAARVASTLAAYYRARGVDKTRDEVRTISRTPPLYDRTPLTIAVCGSSLQVEDVVRYHVKKGGNLADPRPGLAQLSAKLEAAYGAALGADVPSSDDDDDDDAGDGDDDGGHHPPAPPAYPHPEEEADDAGRLAASRARRARRQSQRQAHYEAEAAALGGVALTSVRARDAARAAREAAEAARAAQAAVARLEREEQTAAVSAQLALPVKIFAETLFSGSNALHVHSYGPDPHSG